MAINDPREPPSILRVRVPSETASIVKPFEPGLYYFLGDSRPYLEFEVAGRPLEVAKPYGDGTIERISSASLAEPRHWAKWNLGAQLSKKRRMGSFELPLRNPRGLTLRCYVIPEELLDVADLWRMLEDIQDELRRSVAFDPDDSHRGRSWIREGDAIHITSPAQLLADVNAELVIARSLRRMPRTDLAVDGTLRPSPEMALVSHWACRRCSDIARVLADTERNVRSYSRLLEEPMPKNRTKEFKEHLVRAAGMMDELAGVQARVCAYVIPGELAVPISFGPMSQRDHRLRRLLRAFTPPRSQIISPKRQRSWSLFPPTAMNRVFELWGAVWMVHVLRGLGYEGSGTATMGTNIVESARWRLRRGDVTLALDYEPRPRLLDFSKLPSPRDRAESAASWAIHRQFESDERPYFGAETKCSPDYLIRVQGPVGRALAVGDACLADPSYHTKKSFKPSVVARYRSSIFWGGSGFVEPCHPLGGFVVYPGPSAIWQALEQVSRALDIWFFCPRPRDFEESAGFFARFVDQLVDRVTP